MKNNKYAAVDENGNVIATGWTKDEQAAEARFEKELSTGETPVSYKEWENNNKKVVKVSKDE